LLTIKPGKATDVTFYSDGKGSVTEDKPITNLSPAHDASAVCTIASSDGGGGSSSLPLLAALFCIPALGVLARRLIRTA
jgi:hypothetical protein